MESREFHKRSLCNEPKEFDSVDMSLPVGAFIASMVNTIMLCVSKINQTAVTTPRNGMDCAILFNEATNHGMQCFSGTIMDNFCLTMVATLQGSVSNCLLIISTTSIPFDTLDSKGRSVGIVSDSFSEQLPIAIECVSVQSGQKSDFLDVWIESKVPYKFSKIRLKNS